MKQRHSNTAKKMTQKSSTSNGVTIGRLSFMAKVGVDTVRFYERSGLLTPSNRTDSGYRLYSKSTVARIQFIRRAKEIGLSLDQIRTILDIHDHGGATRDVRNFAAGMIPLIEEQVRGLSSWQHILSELVEHCDTSNAEVMDSSVVQALLRSQCSRANH